MTIEVGKKAPAFSLASAPDGAPVSLADQAGKIVVLYFYPKDSTPGCTLEGQEFTALGAAFKKAGAVVFGVSKDSIASHCKFIDKYELGVTLLSDPDAKMMTAYGAWGEKVMYGKKLTGVIRSTVLVGADGKVKQHWKKVTAKGHAAAVLEAVKALKA